MNINDKLRDFVSAHINDDPTRLRLKFHDSSTEDFDVETAITQIECRRRFTKKLEMTLSACPDFIFADTLSGEQSTSDALSLFHARLIEDGDIVVDMTSGLGIDVLHLAERARCVTAYELSASRCEALRHNSAAMRLANITVVNGDSVEALHRGDISGDVVFIDPARRDNDGGRLYAISDCQPDVSLLLDNFKKHFKKAIIKTSPMLDISDTLSRLTNVTDVYALGTATECRELVFVLDFTRDTLQTAIHAVTLNRAGETISQLTLSHDNGNRVIVLPIDTARYIYEPYPTVMKIDASSELCTHHGVTKIHNNTNLYFSDSDTPVSDFPGDTFVVDEIIDWKSKNLKHFKKDHPHVMISTRNFGMTTAQLRAKLNVTDGGTQRLFAVTDASGSRRLILCSPL